jgi:ABC-type transporter Mla subunit MlaD
MALMNELLEEAVAQCTALSQQTNEAAEAIGSLIDRADHLGERLTSEADQAHRLCQDLAAHLTEAEHGLEGAGRNAGSHLAELGTRAGEVRDRVGQLLGVVHKDLDDLEAHRAHLLGDLDPQVDAAGSEFEQLAHRIADLEAATNQHLQAAGQAIHGFHDAVAAARGEIDQRKEHFHHALQDLETAVAEQIHTLTDGIHALLTDQATHLIEMANRMLTEHNQTVVALRKKFAEEAKEHIAAAAAPLSSAIETLGELAANRETSLKEKSQEVLDRVRQAVQIMEEIKPALESAARLH